jgi:hypothetical protein
LPRVVIQHGAEFSDDRLQHRFADELVPPDFVQQRVFGDQRPRLPRKRAQHGEWRGRESDNLAIAQQASLRLIQVESAEAHLYRS